MPDTLRTSCDCIPYRELHCRQSVEIWQEIVIPEVLLERSLSHSAALRRLAVIHLTALKLTKENRKEKKANKVINKYISAIVMAHSRDKYVHAP